jgi:hypothetical protein
MMLENKTLYHCLLVLLLFPYKRTPIIHFPKSSFSSFLPFRISYIKKCVHKWIISYLWCSNIQQNRIINERNDTKTYFFILIDCHSNKLCFIKTCFINFFDMTSMIEIFGLYKSSEFCYIMVFFREVDLVYFSQNIKKMNIAEKSSNDKQ